jgi:hypothetical protein
MVNLRFSVTFHWSWPNVFNEILKFLCVKSLLPDFPLQAINIWVNCRGNIFVLDCSRHVTHNISWGCEFCADSDLSWLVSESTYSSSSYYFSDFNFTIQANILNFVQVHQRERGKPSKGGTSQMSVNQSISVVHISKLSSQYMWRYSGMKYLIIFYPVNTKLCMLLMIFSTDMWKSV